MDTMGFLATLVLFFAAGFYFLTRKVFVLACVLVRPWERKPAPDVRFMVQRQVLKGNDNKAIQVQLLFSSIFMISCSMFSLVLFEGQSPCSVAVSSARPQSSPGRLPPRTDSKLCGLG